MKKLFVIIFFAFFLTSCASVQMYREAFPRRRTPEKIEVYNEPPNRSYIEIGEISHTKSISTMKKKAAKIGADAIILKYGGVTGVLYGGIIVTKEVRRAIAIKFVEKE